MIDLVVPGDRDRASLPDCGGACHAPRPARMIATFGYCNMNCWPMSEMG